MDVVYVKGWVDNGRLLEVWDSDSPVLYDQHVRIITTFSKAVSTRIIHEYMHQVTLAIRAGYVPA